LDEKNFKDKERERNQCKSGKISSERNKNSPKKLDYTTYVKFCIFRDLCNIYKIDVFLSKSKGKK